MAYTVTLTVRTGLAGGFWRDHTCTVETLADASRMAREFMEYHDITGSTFKFGAVRDASGNDVATISYNARVWCAESGAMLADIPITCDDSLALQLRNAERHWSVCNDALYHDDTPETRKARRAASIARGKAASRVLAMLAAWQ